MKIILSNLLVRIVYKISKVKENLWIKMYDIRINKKIP